MDKFKDLVNNMDEIESEVSLKYNRYQTVDFFGPVFNSDWKAHVG